MNKVSIYLSRYWKCLSCYVLNMSCSPHRCKEDETVQFYSNHTNKVQFGMKAFKFIGWHDQVTDGIIDCSLNEQTSFMLSMFCIQLVSLPKGLHHLLSHTVWGWTSQHQMFSGLHQCHCPTCSASPSQERGYHSDHQSLHLPGARAAQQECWHQECSKHRWLSSCISPSVAWVLPKCT